jgi:hypothetical protein
MGSFLKMTKVAQPLGLLFSRGKSYALILTKKWVGLLFGRFFRKLVWSPCPGGGGLIVLAGGNEPVFLDLPIFRWDQPVNPSRIRQQPVKT